LDEPRRSQTSQPAEQFGKLGLTECAGCRSAVLLVRPLQYQEVIATMKYVLLFCGTDEDAARFAALSPDELRETYARVGQWWQANQSKIVGGEQLQPATTATTVRPSPNGGEPVITDGPFIEAKEQIGGFAIIDVPDLDEALRMARTWPSGPVEIRPVVIARP
jgi:hypothetical protein